MKQYIQLLNKIVEQGIEKGSGRDKMPDVLGLSGEVIKHDLANGFPLLTTKKMFLAGVIHELLWFLRGETHIKYLVDNNVNIWNKDAYRWYLHLCRKDELNENYDLSLSDFIDLIKGNNKILSWSSYNKPNDYELGDLGKVYGYQWRNYNGEIDQINNIIESLKTNPLSRYHILDAWSPQDFSEMALPPCHLLYQFTVMPYKDTYKLNLQMYQRSCDVFLGVPFNLASMALLLIIIAKTVNMIPGEMTWIGGDVHLYKEHLDMALEQISREPYELPTIIINKELDNIYDIEKLKIDDFIIHNYKSHPKIKATLFAGI